VQTSADWTGLRIDSGAAWMRPELIDVSQAATSATMENGRFQLLQPLANAQAGESVEMIHDLFFHSVAVGPDARVRFAIERGHIGQTTVTISNAIAGTPTPVATFTWDGVASDPMNTGFFELPAELLVLPQ
jgi:hypothetical protein